MTTATPATVTDFLIQTIDGRVISKGDTNFTPLGNARALLESYDHQGDFVELTYSGGLTVSIPEAQIAYLAELAT